MYINQRKTEREETEVLLPSPCCGARPRQNASTKHMKRARRSTAFDYTGPLVLPAYAHEHRKQRRPHASSQVPATRRPTAPNVHPPAASRPALRKPPPAAPARLAVQRVWDRTQYAWPRVKQALEHEYDLLLTEAGGETSGLVILSSKQESPLWGERGTERQREVSALRIG